MRLTTALLLLLLVPAAMSQDYWPDDYRQPDGTAAQAPQAPAAWQEEAATIPAHTPWQPFQCSAPNSNYYSNRMTDEIRQCLDGHARVFATLHQLFPQGIGYEGEIRWSISINPNGRVARATPAAPGKPHPDYLRVAAMLLKEVRFGDCRTCPTELYEYVIQSPR